ncbi:YraN family protein [Sedimenticola sp.]|uniref:YraN family protein n=1 Tax=Sedimenticola sp. TaxID=1940285 RepID=UPI003D0B2B37
MRRFFQGRKSGEDAETRAQQYLEQQGLRTLQRNYLCRAGEIDIIMQHRDTLVFVEVRYRKQSRFGSAAESITTTKQKKIIRAANHYLNREKRHDTPCRFDVVTLTGAQVEQIEWISDAFQLELV